MTLVERRQADHIGWLLAADNAPNNVHKGERLLANASSTVQRAAKARAAYLTALYIAARIS